MKPTAYCSLWLEFWDYTSQFVLCPLVADSKDFPYNASFAAFVYRVSFVFSGFACGIYIKVGVLLWRGAAGSPQDDGLDTFVQLAEK